MSLKDMPLSSLARHVVVGECTISAMVCPTIQTPVGIEITIQPTVVLKRWFFCYRTGVGGITQNFSSLISGLARRWV